MTGPARDAVLALAFLTAVPVRTAPFQPAHLGRAAVWFPVVGLLLGAALSLLAWLFSQVFPPALAAALVVAAWAALTGGLHLDGLADAGDGLLSVAGRERRLEIMRDPRLGAFGALTLILFLLVKVLAVAQVAAHPLWHGGGPVWAWPWPALLPAGPLLLAPLLARWFLLLAARQPAARPGGLGAGFAAGLHARALLAAGILPVLFVLLGGFRALAAALIAGALVWAVLRWVRARLGGVTGDVFGLVVELAELAVLLVFAAHV